MNNESNTLNSTAAASATAPAPLKLGRAQWLTLAAAFLGWMFDGLEMGIFPIVSRPALKDLTGTVDPKMIGYIMAMFLVGTACGGLLFGWVGDKIGRVKALAASITCFSLFNACGYFATQAWHLGALLFCAALGMGGAWAVCVALVMECWPERLRPILSGCIGVASNVGYALIGLITWNFTVTTGSWRWVMLAGAAPSLLAMAIIGFVPESTKWKETVKKKASNTHPIIEIFGPGLRKKTLIALGLASVALIGTWGSVQLTPIWADQLANEKPKTVEVQQAQSAEVKAPDAATAPSASTAQVKSVAPAKAKGIAMFCLACGAIIGSFSGPQIGARFGRRIAYFSLCTASLLSCAFFYRYIDTFGAGFLITAFFVGMCTATFYGWLPLYLPELFPTRVRATGQGFCYNGGRILAATGALLQGSLMAFYNNSFPKASSVVTLVYIVGMVIIWFAPETKGKPLPE